ncbi:hypothetical protein [Amycolatopsis regifaucium]|uniref:Uncharacterized protein n=1 Tax=Amycolatopsis regifaucium TaxID=546365 RepID=A0A154MWJ9_9PSEU|nr:hypothetical protein [Amycolatopsis regifaucium]KZB88645.1 hypothetical protein AVL48_00765 [Amycolatopsis regifaucium]OKA07186.1 hypothetical protein ATP06_0215025 [Amycolatopsis regifaucium]SFI54795.1 hypothetical protein SAMN04489731_111151 [Amycolatopsis regifaucium]
MAKGGYPGLRVLGMVVIAVFAQAAIRGLFDHSATQLWGAFDWVPGEWGGRLIVFSLLTAAGVVLAGWAHERGEQVSR